MQSRNGASLHPNTQDLVRNRPSQISARHSRMRLLGLASDMQWHIGESLPLMHRTRGGAVAADQVGQVETWDRAIRHNPFAADHYPVGTMRAA